MKWLRLTLAAALAFLGVSSTSKAYNAYDYYSAYQCMLAVPSNWSVTGSGHVAMTGEFSSSAECPVPRHSDGSGDRWPSTMDFGLVDIYRGNASFAATARVCARHYGAATLYCTAAVSASAGTGYKALLLDSNVSGWNNFHSCGWQYNIYFDVLLWGGDHLI
ncbi:MAG: hypothetical protein QME94_16405, partial [Anaerolineae bacterium]|nr:hypothetical protein [Anaerolineae bacterium]